MHTVCQAAGRWRQVRVRKRHERGSLLAQLRLVMMFSVTCKRYNNLHTVCCERLARSRLTLHAAARGVQSYAEPPEKEYSEARLEAMEEYARKGGKSDSVADLEQKIVTQAEYDEKQVVWEEGKLFPEKWDQMSAPQKAQQLWMGDRGFLFWTNKLAYGALFVIGFAWVVFRFVGPGLGLYDLVGGPPQQ